MYNSHVQFESNKSRFITFLGCAILRESPRVDRVKWWILKSDQKIRFIIFPLFLGVLLKQRGPQRQSNCALLFSILRRAPAALHPRNRTFRYSSPLFNCYIYKGWSLATHMAIPRRRGRRTRLFLDTDTAGRALLFTLLLFLSCESILVVKLGLLARFK